MNRRNLYSIVTLFFAGIMFGCISPTGTTNSNHPGGSSGTGKVVPFTLSSTNAFITLGNCYVGRSSSSSNWAYWMLPVTFTGSFPKAFIEMHGIKYLNAAGAIIDTSDFTYVRGRSMKLVSSGIFSNTCMMSGDSGCFVGIDSLYNSLASITADSIGFSSSAPMQTSSNMVQTGVTAQSTMQIAVQNTGTLAAVLSDSYALLLDSHGTPLIWTFVSPTPATVAAGSTGIFSTSVSYSGIYSNAKLFADYEDGTSANAKIAISAANAFAHDAPQIQALLFARDKQEHEKAETSK